MLTKLLGNPWILGGVAIACLALAGTAGWYAWDADGGRARADAAVVEQGRIQAKLDTALAVNAENIKTIEKIKERAAAADKLAMELQDQLDASNETALAFAEKIAALRKNPDVQNFLDLDLPLPLRCLYGDTEACAGTPGSD